MDDIVKRIHKYTDEKSGLFTDCANRIHEYAEPSGREYQSSQMLEQLLEDNGFLVERGLKDLPTAFRAVYGNGPVRIGFMCEYDALAALHQEEATYKKGNGGFGHGCGHNLLGTGSAGAGIVLKQLVDEGMAATVVVYGTPAEETLEGKTVLVRNGYFRDVDVVLGWHPHNHNSPGEIKHKAAGSFTMTFHGRAAYACNCPENGRSALDAAELTNIGCNYLREHIDRDSYLHYSYINGGDRPNIVPDYSKLWYMVRAYTYRQMKELEERVRRIARGACMMTDTSVEFEELGDTHDNKVNFTLAELAQQSMMTMGLPVYTDEELAYVARIADAVGVEGCNGLFDDTVLPADHTVKKDNGSTDLADVSQVVPTINMFAACFCKNTPMHSWAVTAQSKYSTAHKGMLYAIKALAYMGARIITEPELLEAVRTEFESMSQE